MAEPLQPSNRTEPPKSFHQCATYISQAVNSVNSGAPLDPGLIKDASESELPIQGRGRYGTALGRAVHAVLPDH